MKQVTRESWILGSLLLVIIGVFGPIHERLTILERWGAEQSQQLFIRILPFSDISSWLQRQNELVMTVEKLEQRVRERDVQMSALQEELQSYKDLRVMSASSSATRIPATLFWSLSEKQLSVGSVEGVGVGDAVLSNGQYVGRVIQTDDHLSDIELVENGTAIWGVIDQPSGERGILQLERGIPTITFLRLIPTLAVGDTIVTAGDSTTDRGLLVGHIRSLDTKLSDPVSRAIVDFGPDPLDQTTLFVVKRTYGK